MEKMLIVIDGELTEVQSIMDNGFGGYMIECDNGCEYQVFQNHDAAGEAAAEYWRDMAENDPEEFRMMVGDENLIKWALGQYAGPGNEQTNSLEDWFELTEDHPEEQWASYDGEEIEGAKFNRHFEFETGFDNRDYIVLYRHN
ncbi:MAG: hypothetical protein EOM23_01775 [Candidatus Moranbacteria bacterium]|nr:hypothetical protein [Candidatus Moranbacteria bacterium]